MKKFFKEFKEFATKGNVLDLAVGVIIGGAFQKIVTSLVNDLVMPFIGLITGNSNFNEQFLILKIPEGVERSSITSLSVASELGVTTFNYGSFITTVLDFLIMAFVIFLMVKGINKLNSSIKKVVHLEEAKIAHAAEVPETPAVPTVKKCPYCLSEIPYEAVKCAFCASDLVPIDLEPKKPDEETQNLDT